MQMMCINDDGWLERPFPLFGFIKRKHRSCKGPSYGDVVTINSSYWEEGVLYHRLVEWPDKRDDSGFEADGFIPLSSIDETEMVREKQTEKACVVASK
jgi:hypothetical protein